MTILIIMNEIKYDGLKMMLEQGHKYYNYHTELSILDKLNRNISDNEILQIIRNIMLDINQYNFSKLRDNCHKCCIEIRQSQCHGFGVFATEDIPKGKIITHYHPTYLRTTNPKNKNESCFIDAVNGKNYSVNDARDIDNRLLDYRLGDNNIFVYGDPCFKDEWSTLGHMMNDLSYDGNADYKWDKGNVYINRNLTVITLREIKTGDELSYNYCLPYWFAPGNKYPMGRHNYIKL